jgi:ATP-dependent exoDNAse (exonuclease V) beta subunit
VAEASEQAIALLGALARGPLAPRLRALAPGVVARELPVLLPADGEAGPVGFVAGAIDLVYRDPADGSFVVADWKTDRVEDEARLQQLAAAYAAQGAHYTRALRDALGLPSLPRFELWFLRPGRVLTVPPPDTRA